MKIPEKIFSVGFNNSNDFFDLIQDVSKYVWNIYFSIPGMEMASGRPFNKYKEEFKSNNFLNKLSEISIRYNISLELLFNSSYDLISPDSKCEYIYNHLLKLKDQKIKISRLTLSDRLTTIYLKTYYKQFFNDNNLLIENSIADTTKYLSINEVDQEFQIFDNLKIPPDNYRNITFLNKLIKKYTPNLFTLTLNEGCIHNCPHRIIHNFLHINEVKLVKGTYCRYILNKYNYNHLLYLRRILPASFPVFIKMGFKKFKIANRNLSTKQTKDLIDSYVNYKNPIVYDLCKKFDNHFIETYLSFIKTCDFKCSDHNCSLCKNKYVPIDNKRKGEICLNE